MQDDRIHASLYTDPRVFDGVAVLVNRRLHGWTYDLHGALHGVPHPGGYDSFDTGAHGLARAPRVSSYRGFVFASLSPAGPTLAERAVRRSATTSTEPWSAADARQEGRAGECRRAATEPGVPDLTAPGPCAR